MNKRIIICLISFCLFPLHSYGKDLNVIMMQATCKIEGNGSIGTGFIIGKPYQSDPPKAYYTLVTAAHVLRSVRGENIHIIMRKKKEDGQWEKIRIPVTIRNGVKDLWHTHPEVDLAAIFVRLPEGTVETLLTTDFLMTDEKLKEYEISPGLDIVCLGYPFGAEGNDFGFPILRSGKIASYPLTPTKELKTFLFDFAVFRGNSGGPVFFNIKGPTYGNVIHIGQTIHGILGVIVREKNITQKTELLYERKETITPLSLAEVVHASFIRELIHTMDAPKQ